MAIALPLGGTQPAGAAEEGLRELFYPGIAVEDEPRPEIGLDAPPPSFPVRSVDQSPISGAEHGFVKTTTGTLVFGVDDLGVPGRMPIALGRVYDSKFSSAFPPPAPGAKTEPRWTQDLGENWILGYSSYLITTQGGFDMATPEGDLIEWQFNGGAYEQVQDVRSPYLSLTVTSPTTMAVRLVDGTVWTYTAGTMSDVDYGLTKIEDRAGNSINLIYVLGYLNRILNSDGRFIDIVRPMWVPGHPTVSFPTYRITKLRDFTGREVVFDYDGFSRLSAATDVHGETWEYQYNTNKKLAVAEDPLGNVYLDATYDGNNRVQTIESNTGLWTISYQVASDKTTFTDALSNVWEYHYDGSVGITTEIHEPTGGIHTVTLDASNDPVTYTPPVGDASTWTYDSLHRPTTYSPPATTQSVTYAYDATNDWVNSVTDLDGGVKTFVRNAAGRVLEEIDALGNKTTATYSTNGDRLTLTLPKGNAPGGSGFTWTFTYDAFGQMQTATDPTGRVFEYDYTDFGAVEAIRRPDADDGQGGAVTAEWGYGRDAGDRLVSTTDPLGNTWTRTYDAAGRLEKVTGPEGSEHRYAYDARHRLTSITVENGVDDLVTQLAYDAVGRLETKTVPSGVVYTYSYDGSSRLTGEVDPLTRSWSYTRDLAGRVSQITHPGSQVVTLTRDGAGRLTQRTLPGTEIHRYEYDDKGLLTKAEVERDPTWVATVEWGYDLVRRPTSVHTIIDEDWGFPSLDCDVTIIYDENGNITGMVDYFCFGGYSYTYDELDRVLTATSANYEDWTYAYDPYRGHRVSAVSDTNGRNEHWTFDSAARLIGRSWDGHGESGILTFAYDGEGRLVTKTDVASGLSETRTYLPSGRLDTVEEYDTAVLSATTTHQYDTVGRLVGKLRDIVDDHIEEFVFEWDDAGRPTYSRRDNIIRQYVWTDSPSDPDSAIEVTRAANVYYEGDYAIEYGFDGRLRGMTGTNVDQPTPETMLSNVWIPTLSDALVYSERVDSQYGLPYRLAQGPNGPHSIRDNILRGVRNPANLVDRTEVLNTPTLATAEVNAKNGLGVTNVVGRITESAEGGSLSGAVTGLTRGTEQLGSLVQFERRFESTVNSFGGAHFGQAEFIDDWTSTSIAEDADDNALSQAAVATAAVRQLGNGHEDPLDPRFVLYDHCEDQIYDLGLAGTNRCGTPIWITLPQPPSACRFEFDDDNRFVRPPGGNTYGPGGVSLTNADVHESSVDLAVFDPGGTIDFVRTYRSSLQATTSLGHRWVHNWDERVLVATNVESSPECEDLVQWVKSDGSFQTFLIEDDNQSVVEPGRPYQIRRDVSGGATTYRIRHVHGMIREFELVGTQQRLRRIKNGANTLELVYSGTDLDNIRSNGIERLKLTYANGELDRVTNSADPTEYVEYEHNAEGELWKVKRQATTLGYEMDGVTPLAALYTPISIYEYLNSNDSDVESVATGNHMLSKVRAAYDTGGAETSRVLKSFVYHNKTGSAADPIWTNAIGVCFGDKPCADKASADFAYDYGSTDGSGHITSTVTDQRDPLLGIVTSYTFDAGLPITLIEDAGPGGLQRTTTFEYTPAGLQDRVVYADGRCTETTYGLVGGIHLPMTVAVRTKAECQGGTPTLPALVTRYTYDEFLGRPVAVTGPDGFPAGTVSGNYDPNDPTWKPYTTFTEYDLHEGYGATVSTACADWGLTCPTIMGDLNGSTQDDNNAYGNIVRETVYVDDDDTGVELALSTMLVYTTNGRLRDSTGPSGVTSRQLYYAPGSPGALGWDWNTESVDTAGSGSYGPPAITQIVPTSGTPIETKTAYDKRAAVIHVEHPGGVTMSHERTALGFVYETATGCESDTNAACVGDAKLRYVRHNFDEWGRSVGTITVGADSGSILRRTSKVVDEFGKTLSFSVDPDVGQGGTPLALTSLRHYDDRQQLVKTVTPEGRVACAQYDGLGRLTTATRLATYDDQTSVCPAQPTGASTSEVTLDAMDRVTVSTDASGLSTYYWYDAHGRSTHVSDGTPNVTGLFTDVTYLGTAPTIPPTSNWYQESALDHVGRPIRTRFYGRDGHGASGFLNVAWQAYDTLGRPTETTAALYSGMVPSIDADEPSPPSSPSSGVRLPTTKTDYDTLGRPEAVIDPLSRRMETVYDAFGRAHIAKAPLVGSNQDQTQSFFDAYGRVESQVSTVYDPTGSSHDRRVDVLYDEFGRRYRSIADPGGIDLIDEWEFDELDRTIKTARRWEAAPGTPLPSLHVNDRVVQSHYDSAGRLYRTRRLVERDGSSNPVWDDTEILFDKDSITKAMIDGRGNRTDWTYDALARLTKREYPETSPGARENTVFSNFDAAGRPQEVEFRATGSPTSDRLKWTYTYDTYGRVLSVVADTSAAGAHPFQGTESQSFSYDDLGRMVEGNDFSDALAYPGAEVITTIQYYDSLGRVYEDDQQLPLNGSLDSHIVTRAFHENGTLERLEFPAVAGQRYGIEYAYDAQNRISSIKAPSDVSNVASTLIDAAEYRYVGNSVWDREYDNGTLLTNTFDALGRRTEQRSTSSTQSMIHEEHYGYGRLGNLMYEIRLHEPMLSGDYNARAYDSDHAGRTVKWSDGELDSVTPMSVTETNPASVPASLSESEEFALDPIGNTISKVRTVGATTDTTDYLNTNELNQYGAVEVNGGGAESFVHDFLGQLRTDSQADQQYVWDSFGRLAGIWRVGDDPAVDTPIATYRYDVFNRRVEKYVPAAIYGGDQTTRFIYDGWRSIEERALQLTSGTPQMEVEEVRARYGFGLSLDEVLWMDRDVPRTPSHVIDPVANLPDGTIESRFYVHHDLRASAAMVTNDPSNDPMMPSAESVVERITYTVYGNATAWHDPDWVSGSGYGLDSPSTVTGLPFLYTGQRQEREVTDQVTTLFR